MEFIMLPIKRTSALCLLIAVTSAFSKTTFEEIQKQEIPQVQIPLSENSVKLPTYVVVINGKVFAVQQIVNQIIDYATKYDMAYNVAKFVGWIKTKNK